MSSAGRITHPVDASMPSIEPGTDGASGYVMERTTTTRVPSASGAMRFSSTTKWVFCFCKEPYRVRNQKKMIHTSRSQ